jgi:hypothetical protein
MAHVFGLGTHVTQAIHADAQTNNKKEGIIGLPRIDRHLIFMHRGDIHMIDLAILPSLADYFPGPDKLASMKSMTVVKPGEDDPPPEDNTPPATFDQRLQAARNYRAPLFRAFDVVPTDMAVMSLCPQCRVCEKFEDLSGGFKILRCAQCKVEKRRHRALYCSEECQKIDWKARHKEEHAGTRPWDSQCMGDGVSPS